MSTGITPSAIKHLEVIREDMRDEIKKRMVQRDKYSIQMTLALTALVAVSFPSTPSSTYFDHALIAAPLVSIYFTTLILYSYRVHILIANYLREEIEPRLASLYGTPVAIEWENYYKTHWIPGIRKKFFMYALWIVTFISLLYLFFAEILSKKYLTSNFIYVIVVAGSIYIWATYRITREFGRG